MTIRKKKKTPKQHTKNLRRSKQTFFQRQHTDDHEAHEKMLSIFDY